MNHYSWMNTYTDRELIEMSAVFFGIKAGEYREGEGLLIKGDKPADLYGYNKFKLGRIWNPLLSDHDQYLLFEEYVERNLDHSLPPGPEGMDKKTYERRMRCIDIADMVIRGLSPGLFAEEWVSPFETAEASNV